MSILNKLEFVYFVVYQQLFSCTMSRISPANLLNSVEFCFLGSVCLLYVLSFQPLLMSVVVTETTVFS